MPPTDTDREEERGADYPFCLIMLEEHMGLVWRGGEEQEEEHRRGGETHGLSVERRRTQEEKHRRRNTWA